MGPQKHISNFLGDAESTSQGAYGERQVLKYRINISYSYTKMENQEAYPP